MFNRTLLALSLSALITSPLYAQSLIEQPLQLSAPEELKTSQYQPLALTEVKADEEVTAAPAETPTEKKSFFKRDKKPKVADTTTETSEQTTLPDIETPINLDAEMTTPPASENTTPTKPKEEQPVKDKPKASVGNANALQALNNAQWSATPTTNMMAKAQVMLDNAYSPAGAIDASTGPKTDKAIRAFQVIYGLPKTGKLDKATWEKLIELNHGQDVFVEYTISAADVDKKLYVNSMPADYGEKSKMKHLGYTRVSEMIGEKFHLDEAYLKRLNPNAKFVAGEKIIVANVHNKLPADITLIVAHKTAKQLYLFNSKNQMVGSFPATFGNDPKALVGEHTITGVARNPWYSYSPSNFVQGNNLKPLSLPPGPNGPVGNIWIGLSKKSFGIHGTPDPSKISTNNSHGCIRLSNWDANNLGNYVQKGVKVRFVD